MRFLLIQRDQSLDSGKISELQLKAITAPDFEELKIQDAKLFKFGSPLEFPWYKTGAKNRLGKLFKTSMKLHAKDKEKKCIARVIDLERVSAYTIESFEERLKQMTQIPEADRFWLQPLGYFIDDSLRVTLFYPESISLYQLLHSDPESEQNLD